MNNKKFVIHFSGASCTGKSAAVEALGKKMPGIYTVAYDALKWHLSGYTRDQRAVIYPLVLGFFEVVCANELPIALIAIIRTAEEYAAYRQIAEKYGYAFISVQLTAPDHILLERFRERVRSAKASNSKRISVTDEGLFLENLKKTFFVPPGTPTFDTSIASPDEIAERISGMIP